MTPEQSEAAMMHKVDRLKRAFDGMDEHHALMLLQASGADFDVAFDSWLEAGEVVNDARYGQPGSLGARLEAAKPIARAKALASR